MGFAVSVVVKGKDFLPSLGGLIESLDLQSLATDTFQVVVVDEGSTDGTVERLEQLTTHRPNVLLLQASGLADEDQPDWLASCQGEYVLELSPHQLLFPEALERLLAFAEENALDVVGGRVVATAAPAVAAFTADQTSLTQGELASAPDLVRLTRASVATYQDEPGAAVERVGVLTSYPTARRTAAAGAPAASTDVTLDVVDIELSWRGVLLGVRLRGRAASRSAEDGRDLDGWRVAVVLRQPLSGLSYVVGDGVGAPVGATGEWSLVTDVDLSGAGPLPLPDGIWVLDVQVAGPEGRSARPVTLGWVPCKPALLHGRIVVPGAGRQDALQLDLGATTWPLLGQLDAARSTVTESVAGSLMEIELPQVHVSGAAVVPGDIALGRFRLKASIVAGVSGARLTSLVSGLPGSSTISTHFGTVGLKPTGLSLDISPTGSMTVVKTPSPAARPAAIPAPAPAAPVAKAPAKKAPAKKAPAKKAPAAGAAKPAGTVPTKSPAAPKKPAQKKPAQKKPAPKKVAAPASTAARVRHALPKSWEPTLKKLAANPVARDIYRKLAGL